MIRPTSMHPICSDAVGTAPEPRYPPVLVVNLRGEVGVRFCAGDPPAERTGVERRSCSAVGDEHRAVGTADVDQPQQHGRSRHGLSPGGLHPAPPEGDPVRMLEAALRSLTNRRSARQVTHRALAWSRRPSRCKRLARHHCGYGGDHSCAAPNSRRLLKGDCHDR